MTYMSCQGLYKQVVENSGLVAEGSYCVGLNENEFRDEFVS